jgi:uncharacterized protein (DUF1501 family)
MLNLLQRRSRGAYCDGMNRRDFLSVGTLGLGGLCLPGLLQARAAAEPAARKDTSVIMLWLEGGPSHIETFNPIMDAPVEYRSVLGAVPSKLPGVPFGGLLPKTAQRADQLALVHSFCHNESSHFGGAHFLKTGHALPPNVPRNAETEQSRPAMGSIVSALRGPNHPRSGVPAYIEMPTSGRMQGGRFSGPAYLGGAHGPFQTANVLALNNMTLKSSGDVLKERRALLDAFDNLNRDIDRGKLLEGADACQQQAFGVLAGRVREAFDLSKEDTGTREKFGKGLGERLLLARRLCQAGAGFVTVYYGGWDTHGNFGPMTQTLEREFPPLDHALAAFLDDLKQRSLEKDILLVITGEFGRSPKISGERGGRSFGREHWPDLCTLALAGGGFRMGQVIGQSTAKAERPKSKPIGPQDLMATICHFLGIDPLHQVQDASGRPLTLFDEGKVIDELV